MKKISLFLFIKADKLNNDGDVPLYLKIKLPDSNSSLCLGIKVNLLRWKQTNQFKNSRINEEIILRNKINQEIGEILSIYNKLELRGLPISSEQIKRVYLNGDVEYRSKEIMLSELFDKHQKMFKPLVDNEVRAKDTLRKYHTLRGHVYSFISYEFGLDDVTLNSLNYSFIESFDAYLRSTKKIGNNTTVKYIQGFRRLMNLAVKYDWLQKDPFVLYDKKIIVEEVEFLTKDELFTIENLKLHSKRLEVVRDIFVFGCYTGYSPVDIQKLMYKDVVAGNDGCNWIINKRTKTGIKSDVPLLPKAEEIIDKYRNDPYCAETGLILPYRSNQKINDYLKEIADIAEINKKLHFYIARHTFACTVILANGLSMEVLSKMMGHTNIKQTMHYGKIQNERVANEMSTLRNKFLTNNI
jgi:integrase